MLAAVQNAARFLEHIRHHQRRFTLDDLAILADGKELQVNGPDVGIVARPERNVRGRECAAEARGSVNFSLRDELRPDLNR